LSILFFSFGILLGGNLRSLSLEKNNIRSSIKELSLILFKFSKIDFISVSAINPETIVSTGNPKSTNKYVLIIYAKIIVKQYIKTFAIDLDNPELVIGCFSLNDAITPVIKSTNIRNKVANITLDIGARKVSINKNKVFKVEYTSDSFKKLITEFPYDLIISKNKYFI
jgi:hypothetical protein